MKDSESPKETWAEPEIVVIGKVVDLTGNDPQYNLRDNQGSTPVAYKVGTKQPDNEVELDD